MVSMKAKYGNENSTVLQGCSVSIPGLGSDLTDLALVMISRFKCRGVEVQLKFEIENGKRQKHCFKWYLGPDIIITKWNTPKADFVSYHLIVIPDP